MPNEGILIIDKPNSISIDDMIKNIRNTFNNKKIDYTNELKQEDSGIVIVSFGIATLTMDYINMQNKEYVADIIFGSSSNTYDKYGEIKKIDTEITFTERELKVSLVDFIGYQVQEPLLFSSIKSKSQANKSQPTFTKRDILVNEIEVIEFDYPRVKIRFNVDSKTMINVLVNDVGAKMGTGAYLENIRITKIGNIDLNTAILLENVDEKSLISMSAFPFFNRIDLCEDDIRLINRGMLIRRSFRNIHDKLFSGFYKGRLISILEYIEEKNMLRPLKVFNY